MASQPHPERKGVLIEVNALLLCRHPRRQRHSRARVSAVVQLRLAQLVDRQGARDPDLVAIDVNAHYSLGRVIQPPIDPGPTPFPPPPATVPDIRSLFLGFYYNFAKLPDDADVTAARRTIASAISPSAASTSPTTRSCRRSSTTSTRWRLEKKDPAARAVRAEAADRLLDRPQRTGEIPPDDRRGGARMEQGIREDRLQGRDRSEDPARRRRLGNARRAARVDPLDDHRAAVVRRHRSVARSDPRSGEILDADIGIDPVLLRNRRFQRVEQIPDPVAIRAHSRSTRSICARPPTTRRRSRASRSTSSKRVATSSPTVPRRSDSRSTR